MSIHETSYTNRRLTFTLPCVHRPIHDAVEADNINTVRVLLCAGADVTMRKYSGDAVLHLAKSPEMKRFIEGLLTSCFMTPPLRM